jgi:hypothetical protein
MVTAHACEKNGDGVSVVKMSSLVYHNALDLPSWDIQFEFGGGLPYVVRVSVIL